MEQSTYHEIIQQWRVFCILDYPMYMLVQGKVGGDRGYLGQLIPSQYYACTGVPEVSQRQISYPAMDSTGVCTGVPGAN